MGAHRSSILCMNQSPSNRVGSASRSLWREGLVLGATLVLSVLLVALVVFAPASFTNYGYNNPGGVRGYTQAIVEYFTNLLRGQLATTRGNAQAWRLLLESARRTLELLGVSLIAAIPLGLVWTGLIASPRWPRLRPALLALNTLVLSLPAVAILLLSAEMVANFTFRTGIQLTYVQGYGFDRHLILPAGTLALRGAAAMAYALAIAQEDILRQEWIRAARARGLGGLQLWWRHIMPALRLPTVGILLSMLRQMVSSIIIVEYVYGWNGMGRRMLDYDVSAINRPENAVALTSALILVTLFVLVDSLGRIALRYADPRLREREATA